MIDDFSELETDAPTAARRLLGCLLESTVGGKRCVVRIVETEAYDQSDAASHSYKGKTPRTEIMFGPAGFLYVYFTYGMHYCCNVVTGFEGEGSAVLIRAVEPLEGSEVAEHRREKTGKEVTNGPAKLCQALGIAKQLNGHDLHMVPLRLIMQPPIPELEITATPRIGIKKAVDIEWRFFIANNPYISGV